MTAVKNSSRYSSSPYPRAEWQKFLADFKQECQEELAELEDGE